MSFISSIRCRERFDSSVVAAERKDIRHLADFGADLGQVAGVSARPDRQAETEDGIPDSREDLPCPSVT
jgi:hypothetical protein